jgi:hypothetical protein
MCMTESSSRAYDVPIDDSLSNTELTHINIMTRRHRITEEASTQTDHESNRWSRFPQAQ